MLFGYADCKSNKHRPRARTHILTDKLYTVRFLLCVYGRKSRDRFRIVNKTSTQKLFFNYTYFHVYYLVFLPYYVYISANTDSEHDVQNPFCSLFNL